MKKHLSFLLCFIATCTYAQDHNTLEEYREKDTSTHSYGYLFNKKSSDSSVFTFLGFEADTVHREWVKANEHPTMSNKKGAVIVVRKDNISRMILYASISGDSTRNEKVSIDVYRSGSLFRNYKYEQRFRPRMFEDIYLNFDKPGLDSIRISFSDSGFVMGKLKVIPFSEYGVQELLKREQQDKQIQDLQRDLDTAIMNIEDTYEDQLDNIRFRYGQLRTMIYGGLTESLAIHKASSTNPVSNDLFLEQYENFLKSNFDSTLSVRFDQTIARLKSLPIMAMLSAADQLITGGRLEVLLQFVGGALDDGVQLAEGQIQRKVMLVDSMYYSARYLPQAKIKLVPLSGPDLDKIENITRRNDSFLLVIKTFVEFYHEDVQDYYELNRYFDEALKLRNDYEVLVRDMFTDYMDGDTTLFYNGDIRSHPIGRAFRKTLEDNELTAVKKQELRTKWYLGINELNRLNGQYDILMSKIKSQYDRIYEDVPKSRLEAFSEFQSESSEFYKYYDKFKGDQNTLISLYTTGLQGELHKAAGG